LASQRKHALRHGDPDRQIAIQMKDVARGSGGWTATSSVTVNLPAVQSIETGRDAVRDIPNVAWRCLSDCRE
jgi:hypothetical protein